MSQEKTIEQVRNDWESRLMAIPGVTGVSIGLTKDRRQTAIKVYIDRQHIDQKPHIPSNLEGYPVEIEVRGTFRAW